MMFSHEGSDLKVGTAGTSNFVTIKDWYTCAENQLSSIEDAAGQSLVKSNVDQLIQAMATFTTQTGLSWEQAAQQGDNSQYQGILATYYSQQQVV